MTGSRTGAGRIRVRNVTSELSSRETTRYSLTVCSPVSEQSVSVDCVELPDVVAVIPYCHVNRSVYLVEQVRPTLFVKHGWMTDIEVPAGFIEPGETSVQAAARELREETGFSTDRMTHLCDFVISPGFTGEKTSLYLASVKPAECIDQWFTSVDGETLKIRRVRMEDVSSFLGMRQVHSALTLLALNWCLANTVMLNGGDGPLDDQHL